MQKRDAIQETSEAAFENEQAVCKEHSKDEHTTTGSKSIYELLEEDIMTSDIPEAEKAKRLSRLIKISNKQVNIMLVGSTGSGKSSTVNALFNMNIAKVGVGVDPETLTNGKIVPFAKDFGDNYYCINLDNSKVYYWEKEDDSYFVLADCFSDFIIYLH